MLANDDTRRACQLRAAVLSAKVCGPVCIAFPAVKSYSEAMSAWGQDVADSVTLGGQRICQPSGRVLPTTPS